MMTTTYALTYYLYNLTPKERLCVRIALESGQELNFGDPVDWLSFIPYTRRDDVIASYSKLRKVEERTWWNCYYAKLNFMRYQDLPAVDKSLT